jgi:hypothetical protein
MVAAKGQWWRQRANDGGKGPMMAAKGQWPNVVAYGCCLTNTEAAGRRGLPSMAGPPTARQRSTHRAAIEHALPIMLKSIDLS